MGGYGPPSTTHSRALKFIGDRLEALFGDEIEINYIWNIMDFGYRADEIMSLTESGVLTISYQSTSYLTGKVPELGFVDLPFLFSDLSSARTAFDGRLGKYMINKIEEKYNFHVFGFLENGFRHISNKVRSIQSPEDILGLKIRMLPSEIHFRSFELLGAKPIKMDLTEAINLIKKGELDAQENPLANTVTYGVHKYHQYHTLSSHFYLTRGIWANRDSVNNWPKKLKSTMESIIPEAISYQRKLAEEEEVLALKEIESEGCEVIEFSLENQKSFLSRVEPLYMEGQKVFGDAPFKLLQNN
tara:strand:- start:5495 stop:6397 length:903 start_codon:yes stop_codon:yes gene_type:complete